MANQFLARPRRAVRWLILGAAGLAVIAVAGLCIQTAFGPKSPDPTGVPAADPVPGQPTGIGKDGAAAAGQQAPLQLVPGRKYTDGVSTGYPDTLTGAVSAAVEFTSVAASTLNAGTAASVSQMVADPSYKDAAAQAAQGVAASRQQMGLPVSGPVPQGASISFSPSEYQIRTPPGRGLVTVLLLGDLTETTASGGTQVRLAVVPVPLHWAGKDWKVLTPDASADYSSLSATPGTQGAAGLGWQPIAF
jgi:hypothetical protein